jgi:hypothetical protein
MTSDFDRIFWAVIYKGEDRIVRIDSRGTRRIAVYESLEDAEQDCDQRKEEVIEIRLTSERSKTV